MTGLTVYSRTGCHLCEVLIDELRPLCAAAGVPLSILDVDENDGWRDRYGLRVPVVCAEETEISGWPLDRVRVRAWLSGVAGVAPPPARHEGR
jgi:hypothetical protein